MSAHPVPRLPALSAVPVAATAAPARKSFSVSKVLERVRAILDQSVKPVWIRGEVSGWTRAASGHCYFSLRDEKAQLSCVLFRAEAARLPMLPRNGMEVEVFGAVTAYPARGTLQLQVERLESTDAGGLWHLAVEELKRKLGAEGLLDASRKRPLPTHPACVGVVTSGEGAVFHDIARVIERRAPWTRLVLSPCRVQGDGAADDIARAIGLFARRSCADVLIVGRGGGSMAELWPFNEEPVARAIASCPVPVISAVGHETDFTVADLVADVRAATPSVAAERAVPDGEELRRWVDGLPDAMAASVRGRLERWEAEVEAAPRVMEASIRRHLDRAEREVETAFDRMTRAARERARLQRQRMLGLAGHLEALSPLASLRRGYAVATDGDGRLVRDASALSPGDRLSVQLQHGRVGATVDEVHPEETMEEPDVDAG